MRNTSVILAAAAVLVIGAGCSSNKPGTVSTGPQDWKRQAAPASYIEQAKQHDAAAPPSGGAPPGGTSQANGVPSHTP